MSALLRIEMIILALIVIVTVISSVNKKKMRIQYSLVWIIISLLLIIISIFPSIVFWFCNILGIETASNLVYLFGIFALLMITFMQTGIISKQSDKIKFLTQIVSIRKYEEEVKKYNEEK